MEEPLQPDLTPDIEPEPLELELKPELLTEGERNLRAYARAMRRRLREDKDALIVITGERGIGKSVLAQQIAKPIDERFKMSSNVLFDPNVKKLRELVYGFPKYSAIIVDELFRIGYRRNWMKTSNKKLNELANLSRYCNQATILCIPNFSDIDVGYQRLVTYWLVVISRGVAVELKADRNPFVADVWHLRENERLLRDDFPKQKLHLVNDNEFVQELSKLPNYVGWMTFPDFTKEEKEEYKTLKKPYELKDDGDELKNELNKRAAERITASETALSKTLRELIEKGYSTNRLEELTGLTKQKIGITLAKYDGVTLQDLKKQVKRNPKIRGPNEEYAL